MARASFARDRVSEFYARTGHLPADTTSAGFDSAAWGYVQSVTWNPSPTGDAIAGNMGNIIVTLSPKISSNNARYTFYFSLMSVHDRTLIWRCNIGNIPRREASGDGTLPSRYTPASCRTS
ncbi:MAG: pilin [Methylobacillus sp.]|nr:pilin [Methylobacillus sp.]